MERMDDEIDLREYLVVIKKRWKLIVSLALIFAVVSLGYSLMQPKMYKATATIMPTDSGGGGLAAALSNLPLLGMGGSISGGEGKLIPILKSRALAQEVMNNSDLKVIFPKLAEDPKLSDEEKNQSAVRMLSSAVEAKMGTRGTGGLLEISVIWTDPKQTAELTNKYVESLGEFLNAHALNVNFQSIDPAYPPKAAFKPKIKINTLIGLVLGLFLSIFLVFFQEYWEKTAKLSNSNNLSNR